MILQIGNPSKEEKAPQGAELFITQGLHFIIDTEETQTTPNIPVYKASDGCM